MKRILALPRNQKRNSKSLYCWMKHFCKKIFKMCKNKQSHNKNNFSVIKINRFFSVHIIIVYTHIQFPGSILIICCFLRRWISSCSFYSKTPSNNTDIVCHPFTHSSIYFHHAISYACNSCSILYAYVRLFTGGIR